MRRVASLLAVLVSACAEAPPPVPYGSNVESLDANGLPPKYSFCVRHAAMKSAAIYDAYYSCRREIPFYVARLGGLNMEEKAAMVDGLQKAALNYAHETVVAQHGAEAVRRTLDPPSAPPPAPANPMRQWADCSVQALIEANGQGWPPSASIGHAKALCHHMWTGTPDAAERLYSKMLASVRAGPVSAPPVGEWSPAEKVPGDLRF